MSFTLRTDDQLDGILTELSEDMNLSKPEVVRHLILEGAERIHRRKRLEAAYSSTLNQYGDALDRLKDL